MVGRDTECKRGLAGHSSGPGVGKVCQRLTSSPKWAWRVRGVEGTAGSWEKYSLGELSEVST